MNSYGKFDEYVGLAAKDAAKASEIVAKSFYKILRKNGFSDAQIINVANNILDCLIQTLDSYKERERSKESPPIKRMKG
jgi:predicted transcriptional regulator